jgi:Phosphoribosylamine-glycine ligase
MRLLLVSNTGFSLGFASMAEFDGHAVTRCSVTSSTQALTDNLPDVLIYDDVACAPQADEARNMGVKVMGASQWSNILESNPEYKDNVIKAIGYTKAPADLKGIEVEVVAWFNGNNFIAKFIAFNQPHILTGNLGIKVLSAGYEAVFGVEKSKLVMDTLDPLEKFLRKAGHRGVFSVSVVVDDKGIPYTRDITANLNRPWTQALYANINKRSSASVLMAMFDATSKPIAYIDKYVCGIMVSTAPYPFSCPVDPIEIRGVNPQNLKHLWQMDMFKKGDDYYSGRISGVIGFSTSRGSTPEEASRRAYRVISNLSIDNIQYRTDIGKGIGEKLLTLQRLGMVPRI